MTSLITSVSDSLQICLLLLACCQSASQPVNQSTTQSGNFLLWVRQPAGLLLTTLAGGIGERERGSERGGNIQGGGKTVSGTDKHIHANSLPFDCIKSQTHTHTQTETQTDTHIHRQTPYRSAAGRIWSLFKSLNYSWLKIHGEPFIWKLGAVQAALWCLIGLKVANPLNKSGRRVVAACVRRMRMWVFTTHLLFISLFFTVLLLCTVQWLLNLKKSTVHREPYMKLTNTVSLIF